MALDPGGPAGGLAWAQAAMKRRVALAALVLIVFLQGVCFGEEVVSATVTKVSDGDTFQVDTGAGLLKVRVYGIDCPEIEQPQGKEAKALIEKLLPLGASIRLEVVDVDRYGRAVALVYLPDGSTLEDALIRAGLAWVYGRYCHRPECRAWVDGEHDARADGAGLWAVPAPVPPWEWRKGAR